MSSCTKCLLHKSCTTVQINGRGLADRPDFMFVGEAPGADEDAQGKAFVGPSGQLLLDAINAYGLRPAFITNTVRCRPPGNKKPAKTFIDACVPYLHEEIRKVKPKVIVVLGATALKGVLGKDKITEYAGREAGVWYPTPEAKAAGKSEGIPVFATYHPAYILRNAGMAGEWEMHFKALRQFVGKDRVEKIQPQLLEAGQAMARIGDSKAPMVAFDFETTAKWPHTYIENGEQFPGGSIRMIGFSLGTAKDTFQVAGDDPAVRRLMEWFCDYPNKIKVCHNAMFEKTWCRWTWGKEVKNLRYDTWMMHYLQNENAPHDLENVAHEFLGVTGWDIAPLFEKNLWTWATVPWKTLAAYNAKDCLYTYKIAEKLCVPMDDMPLRDGKWTLWGVYEKIMRPLSNLLLKMRENGIKIDTEQAKKVLPIYQKILDKEQKKMAAMPCAKGFPNFNPGSHKQVSAIVFDKLKMPKLVFSKTDKYRETEDGIETYRDASCSKKYLEIIEGRHPFTDSLLEWRNNIKSIDYLTRFPKFADGSGRVHTNFDPCFQKTGRVSTRQPELSNTPKDSQVRTMFCSRWPKGKLSFRDYSQLELKLIASESNCKNMLTVFNAGGDLHDATAKLIFGPKFTDEQRKRAKSMNFGIVYGISAWSLELKFAITKDEAEDLVARYKEAYPELFEFQARQHEFVRKNGYMVSRFGRMRRFPELQGASEKDIARVFRQAGNFPIQSTGADITNLAALDIYRVRCRLGLKSLPVLNVHDSIGYDCYPGEAKIIEGITKESMERTIPMQCSWLRVKLSTEVETSYRWGEKA